MEHISTKKIKLSSRATLSIFPLKLFTHTYYVENSKGFFLNPNQLYTKTKI